MKGCVGDVNVGVVMEGEGDDVGVVSLHWEFVSSISETRELRSRTCVAELWSWTFSCRCNRRHATVPLGFAGAGERDVGREACFVIGREMHISSPSGLSSSASVAQAAKCETSRSCDCNEWALNLSTTVSRPCGCWAGCGEQGVRGEEKEVSVGEAWRSASSVASRGWGRAPKVKCSNMMGLL